MRKATVPASISARKHLRALSQFERPRLGLGKIKISFSKIRKYCFSLTGLRRKSCQSNRCELRETSKNKRENGEAFPCSLSTTLQLESVTQFSFVTENVVLRSVHWIYSTVCTWSVNTTQLRQHRVTGQALATSP